MADNKKTIHCKIVTPSGVYREFETPILNVVSTSGELGLLPEHMPLVTMLKISKMTTVEEGQRQEYAITGGLLYLGHNDAKILVDAIENKNEIDTERALAAKERALSHLESQDKNTDMNRASVALERALNRIKVVEGK